jgi:Fungal protein kinase
MVVVNTSQKGRGDVTDKDDFAFTCQPDCSVFVRPAGPPTFDGVDPSAITDSPSCLEFVVEFKSAASNDPFVMPTKKRAAEGTTGSGNPLMKDTLNSNTVVGQITAYATQILSSQYRTHAFTVLICKDLARLIRWDRAGAIVTEPIFYDNESYLHDFLTRYNDAPSNIRGHDSTVTTISNLIQPEIFQRARSVVDELANEDSLLLLAIPEPDGSPTSRHYAVSQPRVQPDVPTGRWTRTSIAYDVQRSRRVLLKDSWRILIDDIIPEGEVYNMLHEKGVPNVPVCSLANDIGDHLHVTRTNQFVGTYLRHRPPHFTAHRHYRLVLDTIGLKLEEFSSSRAMVEAVRAAVQGKCRWLCNVL